MGSFPNPILHAARVLLPPRTAIYCTDCCERNETHLHMHAWSVTLQMACCMAMLSTAFQRVDGSLQDNTDLTTTW